MNREGQLKEIIISQKELIFQNKVLSENSVIYASFVYDYCSLKKEVYQIRIIVGDDRLPYEEDARASVANLLETKLLLNSVISDVAKGARFLSVDIKDHFLDTLMRYLEYMKVKYKYIPKDMYQKYYLH